MAWQLGGAESNIPIEQQGSCVAMWSSLRSHLESLSPHFIGGSGHNATHMQGKGTRLHPVMWSVQDTLQKNMRDEKYCYSHLGEIICLNFPVYSNISIPPQPTPSLLLCIAGGKTLQTHFPDSSNRLWLDLNNEGAAKKGRGCQREEKLGCSALVSIFPVVVSPPWFPFFAMQPPFVSFPNGQLWPKGQYWLPALLTWGSIWVWLYPV